MLIYFNIASEKKNSNLICIAHETDTVATRPTSKLARYYESCLKTGQHSIFLIYKEDKMKYFILFIRIPN